MPISPPAGAAGGAVRFSWCFLRSNSWLGSNLGRFSGCAGKGFVSKYGCCKASIALMRRRQSSLNSSLRRERPSGGILRNVNFWGRSRLERVDWEEVSREGMSRGREEGDELGESFGDVAALVLPCIDAFAAGELLPPGHALVIGRTDELEDYLRLAEVGFAFQNWSAFIHFREDAAMRG